jgi:hypothetical protein
MFRNEIYLEIHRQGGESRDEGTRAKVSDALEELGEG